LPFKTEREAIRLSQAIKKLDEELVELDFSALVKYLAQIAESLQGGLVNQSASN